MDARLEENIQGSRAALRGFSYDRHREFVFPNRVRELRRRQGLPTLLTLSGQLPDIPYIRLSKIERGEVVARAVELQKIASALGVRPVELLLDVDAPDFDIARWAEPFREPGADAEEEQFAIKLAAALRQRRAGDRALTVAAIERDYGIAPVILSRLENAQKTLDRWNAATVESLCRLMGVAGTTTLRALVEAQWQSGALDALVAAIADPAVRLAKSRSRIAALRAELAGDAPAAAALAAPAVPIPARAIPLRPDLAAPRLLPILGVPRAGGVIDPAPVGSEAIEAPREAGPRAFALRVCRPTLGPGLPAHGIVIADPDVWPGAGGLAALREDDGYRLVSIAFDRNGAMRGISVNPELDLPLDGRDPADIAAVIGVIFRAR